jgi:hypothetical protein
VATIPQEAVCARMFDPLFELNPAASERPDIRRWNVLTAFSRLRDIWYSVCHTKNPCKPE